MDNLINQIFSACKSLAKNTSVDIQTKGVMYIYITDYLDFLNDTLDDKDLPAHERVMEMSTLSEDEFKTALNDIYVSAAGKPTSLDVG